MQRYFIISLLFVIMMTGACKKYLNVNEDPNNPANVQESLLLLPIGNNHINRGCGRKSDRRQIIQLLRRQMRSGCSRQRWYKFRRRWMNI